MIFAELVCVSGHVEIHRLGHKSPQRAVYE